MMNYVITIYLGLALVLQGQDWHSKWDRSGSTWHEKWSNTFDSIGNYQENERIDILGSAARAKSTSGGWRPTDDQLAVGNRAVSLLLAIPGHAEYYRERIIKARATRDGAVGKTEYGGKAGDFRTELNNAMETLAQLPSPETVRVLGDFLSDQSANPFPIQDNMKESPLSYSALKAFTQLPLLGKPTHFNRFVSGEDLVKALPAWQQWYEEIKSGKRTFRFEGDPTEYDLNGPAPGQKLDRITRDRKRDAERAAGAKRPGSPAAAEVFPKPGNVPAPASIFALLLPFLLLAGVVWYFAKGHGKRS